MLEYGDGRVAVRAIPPGTLSTPERQILMDLACRVAEVGNHPLQAKKIAFHKGHNALKGAYPAILCFPEGAWGELVPAAAMVCRDPFWRGYELYLRRLLYRWAHLPDDFVIEPTLGVPLYADLIGWGVDPNRRSLAVPGSAWRYEPALECLSDWAVLSPIDLAVDEDRTNLAFQAVGEVLDGILPVYVDRGFTEANPLLLETLCQLRGMENLYYDLMDSEDEVHALLAFLRDSWLALYDRLEQTRVYTPNTGNHYVGSGGVGYCDDLAPDPAHPLKEMWGFCEAQELANVSPAMYREFATEYSAPLLARFGHGCVGCCENLDGKLADLASLLPNLRRVSISPWTNLSRAREELGGRAVLSWKPNPSLFAAPNYDSAEVHHYLEKNLNACRGVPLEIILKDTQTIYQDGARLTDFIMTTKSLLLRD